MMLKVQKIIKDVFTFNVNKENLITKSTGSRLEKSIFYNEKKIDIPSITGFQFYENKVYFSTWTNQSYELVPETFEVKELNFNQVAYMEMKDTLIFSHRNGTEMEIIYNSRSFKVSRDYVTGSFLRHEQIGFSGSQPKVGD